MKSPLAPRVDETVANQHLHDVQPSRALSACRQAWTPEPIQLQTLPQTKGQPARAPLTRRVHLYVVNLDPNHFAAQRRSLTPLGKQRHLPRARLAFQHLDRAAPCRTLAVIDLPQIQHLALHHPPATHAHVLHHAPIAVFLTVLAACLAAHEHEQIVGALGPRIKDQGRHYTGNRPRSRPKNRDLQRQSFTKIAETHGELAKSG